MITQDKTRIKLIERIKADLRKQAVILYPETIEMVIVALQKRLQSKTRSFIHNLP
jgi:hypothetical protein